MSEAARQKILLLDSVRGWAALSVLIFHTFSLDSMPKFPGRDYFYYLQADRAAVLLFFVLSGFVIGLTNQRPWSAPAVRQYGWRRFLRIYPIYLIAVVLGWMAVPAARPTTLLGQLAFLQDSNPTNPLAVPNLPGNIPLWSLHYEALFYLCFLFWWRWPATVLPSLAGSMLAALAGTAWAPVPAVVVTHGVGAAFWLAGLLLTRRPAITGAPGEGAVVAHLLWLQSIYHFAPVYLLQRGLGIPNEYKAYLPVHDLVFLPGAVAAVALAGGRKAPGGRLWHLAAAGLAGIGLAMILAAGKNPAEARWAFSTCYLVAGAVLFFLPQRLGFERLAAVGAFSYALYVVHMPVLLFVGRLFPRATGPGAGLGAVGLAFALIFPLAWWLETRFHPWLRAQADGPARH
ncbi:MAG: acyltransferase [Opitutae bacterium]|nr:acyltransferase [Opitutae bacterium]